MGVCDLFWVRSSTSKPRAADPSPREFGLLEEPSTSSALLSACRQLRLISRSDGTLEQNAARCYKYLYLAGVDVTLAAGIDFEIIEIETL